MGKKDRKNDESLSIKDVYETLTPDQKLKLDHICKLTKVVSEYETRVKELFKTLNYDQKIMAYAFIGHAMGKMSFDKELMSEDEKS